MGRRRTNLPLPELATKLRSRCEETANGCHIWQGAKNTQGYGVMWANGRQVGTHRIALAYALNDPDMLAPVVARGLAKTYVLHSCDTPACCNPAHLRLGNGSDNCDDIKARDRRPSFNPNLPRKFTEEQVRTIRRVGATWDGMCDLMKEHHVAPITITDIVARKTYKHVPD